MVIKPAETTPLSILVLAEIIADADLPPGVVNIITGAGDIGAALVNHPGIDKVAFTGSTEVGKQIQASLAGTGRKITLELGGKAANIVFDDAPIDQAVEGIVNGIFFNQGHVCCAGSRLLVQESVADEVNEKLRARIATLRLGDPMDKNTDIGAINSADPAGHHPRADRRPARPRARSAGRRRARCPDRGFFFPPTVFTQVSQSMRIAREEIFGPVLSVLTFRTPDEAVAKANNTPYGLSAGVWTEKGSRILGMAAALRAGVVWANTFNRFDPTAAFGGYKESGFGREGGRSGLGAYLDTDDDVGAGARAGRRRPTIAAAAAELSEAEALADAAEVLGRAQSAQSDRDVAEQSDAVRCAVDWHTPTPMPRVAVTKTYKLYIGGAFPRSESGRTYPATGGVGGSITANVAQGSRKDARDAVVAARKAFKGWSSATAYNRGQVIYRIAEMLEGRRAQFVDLLGGRADGRGARWTPRSTGWCTTPAGPTSSPRSSAGPIPLPGRTSRSPPRSRPGWSRRSRRSDDSLLGLVSVIAPIITSGNTAVVDRVAAAAAGRGHPGRGAGHLRPARRGGEHPHRRPGRDRAAPGRARRRQRAGPDRRRRRLRTDWSGPRPAPSSGSTPRPRRTSRGCRGPPGCGRSWRSRRCGTRPARCRWRVGPGTEFEVGLIRRPVGSSAAPPPRPPWQVGGRRR